MLEQFRIILGPQLAGNQPDGVQHAQNLFPGPA